MSEDVQERNLYLPGLTGLYRSLAPLGFPLIRLAAGGILIVHGYAKLFSGGAPMVAKGVLTPMGFPEPLLFAYFLGLLETVGAILLAVGLFTRPIALMLSFEFIFVTLWHSKNGFAFSAPHGGFEYPLVLLCVYVGILFHGGGRYSVDRAIGKEF